MSTLDTLPIELLIQICLFLPLPRDTKLLASTCRNLRNKLTIPSNFLWYTFLSKYPKLRHNNHSFHTIISNNPPPVCVASGKYDQRVNYYSQALAILCGRTMACFDCFNTNKRSFRIVYVGGIYYRTYCASCYERYFWLVSDFLMHWPEIKVPPTLIDNQPNVWSGAIHYNDAIFLIKDQLPPRARIISGRFVSKWTYKINIRKTTYPGSVAAIWSEIDHRMMYGTEMDGVIKVMTRIYETDKATFGRYWPLAGREEFREYLEDGVLMFVQALSASVLRVVRAENPQGFRAGQIIWRTTEDLFHTDYKHLWEGNGWASVPGGRNKFLWDTCRKYMMMLFGQDRETGRQLSCLLLSDWVDSYTAKRVGTGQSEHKYRPYTCQFCRDEKPGEKADWDGNYSSERALDGFPHISGLATHILMRHNDRFAERWVTGGGVVEPMEEGWQPFWKDLKAL
ncbi:hypothetical protein TWF730_008958 [Orbilia blumenaviensis]|uniref:F-box domain-containing protein n=1 Tax=Orbilia blumenaviensis TaxID=1796055 RepID=A0AAV9UZP8_9PEZI